MNNSVLSPCKDCIQRSAYCHCSCERYREFDMKMRVKRKEKELEIILDDIQYNGIRRRIKAAHKRRSI